jgi:hypothetical protein
MRRQSVTFLTSSKVMGMIVPVVIGWATYNLTNQQWQTQQRQYQNTIQEQDRGRVMDRLLALGSASSTDRLTAAKALRSYADLNRLDAASLPGLLPYLKSECDEAVFANEKQAALQAARNAKPPNSQQQQQLLAGLNAIERSAQCPAQPPPASSTPPAVTTVVSAPPQYFDVGCGEEKAGVLRVRTGAEQSKSAECLSHPGKYRQSQVLECNGHRPRRECCYDPVFLDRARSATLRQVSWRRPRFGSDQLCHWAEVKWILEETYSEIHIRS